MLYLYVKTHNKTGLKYLGKTIYDPYLYHGSGKIWKLHINKHGYDVSTKVLKECTDKEELKYWGKYYSDLWNVVESDEWANLKPEEGDGGATMTGRSQSQHQKDAVSKALTGIKRGPLSEEHKQKLREKRKLQKPQVFSAETRLKMRNNRLGKKHSEETKRKMSRPAWNKGLKMLKSV